MRMFAAKSVKPSSFADKDFFIMKNIPATIPAGQKKQ